MSQHMYVLDAGAVDRYADAVSERLELRSKEDGGRLAPPMAVAALCLRGVVTDLAIPGGPLHVGQELEFKSAVAVGQTLACSATVAQNSVRGGWRFLVVQLQAEDQDGRAVLKGKSTIMLPVEE